MLKNLTFVFLFRIFVFLLLRTQFSSENEDTPFPLSRGTEGENEEATR